MTLDTQKGRPGTTLIIVAAVLSCLVVAVATTPSFLLGLLLAPFAGAISRSHVEANVPPDGQQFDALLTRDLEHYFKAKVQSEVKVAFELLRLGPTQTGIAFPKFYAWVVIRSRATGQDISQGAVRLSAQAGTFVVTDYISLADMKANPGILNEVFPGPVVDRIRARL